MCDHYGGWEGGVHVTDRTANCVLPEWWAGIRERGSSAVVLHNGKHQSQVIYSLPPGQDPPPFFSLVMYVCKHQNKQTSYWPDHCICISFSTPASTPTPGWMCPSTWTRFADTRLPSLSIFQLHFTLSVAHSELLRSLSSCSSPSPCLLALHEVRWMVFWQFGSSYNRCPYGSPVVKIERKWPWSRGTGALLQTALAVQWQLDFISHSRLASIVGPSSMALIALCASTLQSQSGNTSRMYAVSKGKHSKADMCTGIIQIKCWCVNGDACSLMRCEPFKKIDTFFCKLIAGIKRKSHYVI